MSGAWTPYQNLTNDELLLAAQARRQEDSLLEEFAKRLENKGRDSIFGGHRNKGDDDTVVRGILATTKLYGFQGEVA